MKGNRQHGKRGVLLAFAAILAHELRAAGKIFSRMEEPSTPPSSHLDDSSRVALATKLRWERHQQEQPGDLELQHERQQGGCLSTPTYQQHRDRAHRTRNLASVCAGDQLPSVSSQRWLQRGRWQRGRRWDRAIERDSTNTAAFLLPFPTGSKRHKLVTVKSDESAISTASISVMSDRACPFWRHARVSSGGGAVSSNPHFPVSAQRQQFGRGGGVVAMSARVVGGGSERNYCTSGDYDEESIGEFIRPEVPTWRYKAVIIPG